MMQAKYRRSLKAGAVYFTVIFALGFVLGTVRTLWLTQAIGATAAVLAELPVMLIASWFVVRWLIRRYAVLRAGDRLIMGALAFGMLMMAELALAVLLFSQTPSQWLASVMTMPGPIGLTGQMLFGLMPLLVGAAQFGGHDTN